jgi:hypothetical protein
MVPGAGPVVPPCGGGVVVVLPSSVASPASPQASETASSAVGQRLRGIRPG